MPSASSVAPKTANACSRRRNNCCRRRGGGAGAGARPQRPVALFAFEPVVDRAGLSAGDVRGRVPGVAGAGYGVRKGERAIRIMAPMAIKDREPDGPDLPVDEADSRARVLFRAVSVFDASQVTPLESGEPTPLAAPSEPLTGESHVGLLAPLEAFAASIDFGVCFEALGGRAGGWCDAKARGSSSTRASPATRGCASWCPGGRGVYQPAECPASRPWSGGRSGGSERSP